MNKENQVCTVEQARQLRTLGIEQDTFLCWQQILHHYPTLVTQPAASERAFIGAAYTCAELGAMLPEDYSADWNKKFWPRRRGDYDWVTGDENPFFIETIYEADARAQLLIYLLNTGKITAVEVNLRILAQ